MAKGKRFPSTPSKPSLYGTESFIFRGRECSVSTNHLLSSQPINEYHRGKNFRKRDVCLLV